MRCKRPKCDGEVHQFVRLVADGDDSGVGIGYPTRLVLFFGHIVNDVLLGILIVRSRHVHGAYYVDLIVFKLNVSLVYVYYVVRIVDTKTENKKENIISDMPSYSLANLKLELVSTTHPCLVLCAETIGSSNSIHGTHNCNS